MARVFGLIMAGGVGARFWPKSREKFPKQLLQIIGDGTLIQNTVGRIKNLINPKDIFIITNKTQKAPILKQLSEIPPSNVLVEPIGRSTAPCIFLSALFMQRIDPTAVMVVLPADHIIADVTEFLRVVQNGIQVASDSGALVTIGIHPARPEVGYGYIQVADDELRNNPYMPFGAFRVKTFAEKPNFQLAERFLESGDFVWNSGMFIWRVDSIIEKFRLHLPEMYEEFQKVDAVLGTEKYTSTLEYVYGIIRSISIDYGIMEKAKDVFVLRGNFGWSDVGSWDEVYRIF